jgi:transcriptional regulator with XRE-family HTH domain
MTEKIKEEFLLGEYLKFLREKIGVSLRDVEEELNLPNDYLSKLETGALKKLPAPERLNKLARYYDVSASQLLAKAGYFEPDGAKGRKAEFRFKNEIIARCKALNKKLKNCYLFDDKGHNIGMNVKFYLASPQHDPTSWLLCMGYTSELSGEFKEIVMGASDNCIISDNDFFEGGGNRSLYRHIRSSIKHINKFKYTEVENLKQIEL